MRLALEESDFFHSHEASTTCSHNNRAFEPKDNLLFITFLTLVTNEDRKRFVEISYGPSLYVACVTEST